MNLIGLDIDGVRQWKFDKSQTPTWFFKEFMNYCIDSHHPQITMDDRLHEYFSTTPLDPIFGAAIGTAALCEHNGWHFSTYSGTAHKIGLMVHLANLLGIELQVFTI